VGDQLSLQLAPAKKTNHFTHTVARLIGAPAGYIGFEQGGLLTEAIRKHPNSVLLLDEIEKANPGICNVLLQIMDHATLTDNGGPQGRFPEHAPRHDVEPGLPGNERAGHRFRRWGKVHARQPDQGHRELFLPEFRNRLDEIIAFSHLDTVVIRKIVWKFINELRDQLKPKKGTLDLTEAAEAYLAKEGYNPAYGARPMAKVIQEKIKNALVDELLFGKLQKGEEVTVDA
jgi:ATP-dependent Clp protease ATP-binding subunit ClpA